MAWRTPLTAGRRAAIWPGGNGPYSTQTLPAAGAWSVAGPGRQAQIAERGGLPVSSASPVGGVGRAFGCGRFSRRGRGPRSRASNCRRAASCRATSGPAATPAEAATAEGATDPTDGAR